MLGPRESFNFKRTRLQHVLHFRPSFHGEHQDGQKPQITEMFFISQLLLSGCIIVNIVVDACKGMTVETCLGKMMDGSDSSTENIKTALKTTIVPHAADKTSNKYAELKGSFEKYKEVTWCPKTQCESKGKLTWCYTNYAKKRGCSTLR